MPLSSAANLTPVLMHVLHLNPRPQHILDLGCGFGLYGAALRQYMDIGEGRLAKDQWTIDIRGVEGFFDYRNPLWELYNRVWRLDFGRGEGDSWFFYKRYDLVLMLDCLEHLEKTKGFELVEYLLKNNNRVIVSVPKTVLPQGAVNGNAFEVHRSEWSELELTCMRPSQVISRGICLIVDLKGDYERT